MSAVTQCAAANCISKSDGDGKIYFHSFPDNPEMRQKWIDALGIIGQPAKGSRVCSKHFKEDDYVHLVHGKFIMKSLEEDAVPQLVFAELSTKPMRQSPISDDVTLPLTSTLLVESADPQPMSAASDSDAQSEISEDLETEAITWSVESAVGESFSPQPMSPAASDSQSETFEQIATQFQKPTWAEEESSQEFDENSVASPEASDSQSENFEEYSVQVARTKPKESALQELRSKIARVNEKLIPLQKLVARKKKKIKGLNKKINEFKFTQQNRSLLISNIDSGAFKKTLLRDILRGAKLWPGYTRDVKAFALTLNHFSPMAYRFVRKRFNNALPGPHLMGIWRRKLRLMQFATDALKELKTKGEGEELIFKLLVDGMNWE